MKNLHKVVPQSLINLEAMNVAEIEEEHQAKHKIIQDEEVSSNVQTI